MAMDAGAQTGPLPLRQETQSNAPAENVTFLGRNLFHRKRRENKTTVIGSDRLLEDAEYLLEYACQAGIDLDQEMVKTIVSAGAGDKLGNDDTVRALAAMTKLAARLKPVTADTLRACKNQASNTIRHHKKAIWLGIFLLISSVLSYVTTRLSDTLTADITRANELAVTLNAGIEGQNGAMPQPGALTNLQQYAATIREVSGLSHELSVFVLAWNQFPANEQGQPIKDADMEIILPVDLPREVTAKTKVYQPIRFFAQDIQRRASLTYGAMTNFLLPPLYAIFGAFAYLLRVFSEQIKARTFLPSVTDSARLIIAAIGGGVVGLFSSSFAVGPAASLSPLAIAFLVGYGTDIFFSVLDGLQQAFTKAKPG
ncbi:MAG TPA: hypothetical protein VHT51_20645 [Micropepsaceae bacterium]|jgi:hypothetical protein|nr:hypothetical protein [Micropepsaceae bacterium]